MPNIGLSDPAHSFSVGRNRLEPVLFNFAWLSEFVSALSEFAQKLWLRYSFPILCYSTGILKAELHLVIPGGHRKHSLHMMTATAINQKPFEYRFA